MPQKKRVRKAKRVVARKVKKAVKKDNPWKWTESYNSFLLGVVVVIVGILFGLTFLRHQKPIQQTSSIATGPTITVAPPTPTPGSTLSENGKTYYVVQKDDSLWDIAVKEYNNGFKWVDIAKANNLANPSTIFSGDKLILPGMPSAKSGLGQLQHDQPTPTISNAISGNTYTVARDDTLWDIALRSYGDGYKWTNIAKANNLANPDIIFAGNVLQIPR